MSGSGRFLIITDFKTKRFLQMPFMCFFRILISGFLFCALLISSPVLAQSSTSPETGDPGEQSSLQKHSRNVAMNLVESIEAGDFDQVFLLLSKDDQCKLKAETFGHMGLEIKVDRTHTDADERTIDRIRLDYPRYIEGLHQSREYSLSKGHPRIVMIQRHHDVRIRNVEVLQEDRIRTRSVFMLSLPNGTKLRKFINNLSGEVTSKEQLEKLLSERFVDSANGFPAIKASSDFYQEEKNNELRVLLTESTSLHQVMNENNLKCRVSVQIRAPNTSWDISIKSIYRMGDELWVFSQLSSEGIGASVITEVSDTVEGDFPDLPVKHYIQGKDWNWENRESVTFIGYFRSKWLKIRALLGGERLWSSE